MGEQIDRPTMDSSSIEGNASKRDSCLDDYLDINDLTPSEKMDRAWALKDRGAVKFKDGLFKDAHQDYQRAFKLVVAASPPPPEMAGAITEYAEPAEDLVDAKKIVDLKCALYLNIAACLQVRSKEEVLVLSPKDGIATGHIISIFQILLLPRKTKRTRKRNSGLSRAVPKC